MCICFLWVNFYNYGCFIFGMGLIYWNYYKNSDCIIFVNDRGIFMGFLSGFRIIELVGIGFGFFCGMMLVDMGVEVICVDWLGGNFFLLVGYDILFCNCKSIVVNLKYFDGVEIVFKLCENVDVIFEGYCFGVVEWLGVGLEYC